MHVGRMQNIPYHIFKYYRIRLVSKRVDTGTIIHVSSISLDEISMNAIVVHHTQVAIPAPSHADGRITYIMDVVMLNIRTAYISQSNGAGTPFLVSYIRKLTVLHLQSAAYFTQILRTVRQMSFQTGWRETATNQTVHRNISKATVEYRPILAALYEINAISA